MYHKVHLQLTILCAGITASIMIIMSFLYLHISEDNLYKNQFSSFQNDIATITTNLEQQSIITMEYLSKLKTKSAYSFFLLDNGIPLLYNQLMDLSDQSRQALLAEILDACQKKEELTDTVFSHSESISVSGKIYIYEFKLHADTTNANYFCAMIEIHRDDSCLQTIALFPLQLLEQQIKEQRVRFVMIDGAAILLLFIFSWIFTGILLKPIIENQQKQVQFVASASHELRTPLAVILSSAECLNQDADKKQAGFLKNIRQSGLRMSSLIDDLLTLSASDSGRFPVQKNPTELDTLLIDSYETFLPIVKEKAIALSLDLPEDTLPPCCCDPDRIKQVISILLHNAVSYTKEHGRICLSLSHQKNNFFIRVQDNGIGISDEDKKKIFDRFYRAEKSRSTKGHFGLGLSIAKEIITAHHGSISVADAPDGGSVFTVQLP